MGNKNSKQGIWRRFWNVTVSAVASFAVGVAVTFVAGPAVGLAAGWKTASLIGLASAGFSATNCIRNGCDGIFVGFNLNTRPSSQTSIAETIKGFGLVENRCPKYELVELSLEELKIACTKQIIKAQHVKKNGNWAGIPNLGFHVGILVETKDNYKYFIHHEVGKWLLSISHFPSDIFFNDGAIVKYDINVNGKKSIWGAINLIDKQWSILTSSTCVDAALKIQDYLEKNKSSSKIRTVCIKCRNKSPCHNNCTSLNINKCHVINGKIVCNKCNCSSNHHVHTFI